MSEVLNTSLTCDNGHNEAARRVNVKRPLTHSSDFTREQAPMKTTCSVDGCDHIHYAYGMCNMHWQRVYKNGDLKLHNQAMPVNRKRARGRWRAMIRRCTNPQAAGYHRYGGRGITVCDRWLNFNAFYEDMGDPPQCGMSLDRINNDGPYSPENVRWATDAEQAANREPLPRPEHCPQGHSYSAGNTYTYPDGRRKCYTCYPLRTSRDGYLGVHDATEPGLFS